MQPCILFRTIPKLLQIIGQICAFDRWYLPLTHSFGLTPKLITTKLGHKKLETVLCFVVQNVSIS